MTAWLYQMTANDEEPWYPEQYRLEVWEGDEVTWPVGKIYPRGQGEMAPGDIVVFFFSKMGISDPGIYGWAIVTDIRGKAHDRISFVATAPSDFLKTCVCWDDQVEALVNKIRGKMKQATLWGVRFEELAELRKLIRAHIGSQAV